MDSLLDKLIAYSNSDFYGFHMPGHKRNAGVLGVNLPFEIDITEIEGFDDLHHAEGILKETEKRAARVYHAQESHFLINGSTCGIMSAIMGCTRKGESILVARNCHKSIYSAIYLNELKPVYVYPKFDTKLELNGEILAGDVAEELAHHPEIRTVMMVSPTYDGVVSDVEAIAKVVHAYGAILIVDEAHGAHFGFDAYFPKNANEKGADIVVHSVHKTLPSMTQTALIHMNGSLVKRGRVKRYLDILQTSSPSYVLMASIDACMEMLEDEARRKELFGSYVKRLADTRERLQGLQHLKILETEHFDPSKIVISVKDIEGSYTSRDLYMELIENYHLQMEMVAGSYVLAMTTIGDTQEGMNRLVDALFEIDQKVSQGDGSCELSQRDGPLGTVRADVVYTIADVIDKKYDGESQVKAFHESIGYISTEFAYLYPPGIPILVPGERVSEDVIRAMEAYERLGFQIEGLEQEEQIEVWNG